MMDWNARRNTGGFEALVGLNPFAEGRIEKCQMIEAGAALGFFDQTRDLGQGDAMMLLVIGHENQKIVLVKDLGVEHGLIPLHHFFEPGGAKHRVREFRRGYRTRAAAISCFAAHCVSSLAYRMNYMSDGRN